jgi:hypothetical protein
LKRHPDLIKRKIVGGGPVWDAFSNDVAGAFSRLRLSDEDKALMVASVGGLNKVPHRVLTERLLRHLGLDFGADVPAQWSKSVHPNVILRDFL